MENATGNPKPKLALGVPSTRNLVNAHEAFQKSLKTKDIGEKCTLLWTACVLCLVKMALLALYAWEIYLFQTYKDETCEQKLPLWLGIEGISGIVVLFAQEGMTQFCPGEKDEKGKGQHEKILEWITRSFSLVLYMWLSVMVYSMDYDHPRCSTQVFYFTWGLLLAMWIFTGIVFVGYCCLTCIGFAVAS